MFKKGKLPEGKIKYNRYVFSMKERIRYSMQGILILMIFAYFFYKSVWAAIFGLLFLPLYLKQKNRELCEKRKRMLQVQFKETLLSVNSSVQGGYSLENAFTEAKTDISSLYGKDAFMARELKEIERGIKNNQTLEEKLMELGKRSASEDIENFANMLFVGKRSGGNINEMLESSIHIIEEKVSLSQEIQTIIHAKKTEQKVMSIIPFFMIAYVNVTSGGYFAALYHNSFGVMVMTFCLCLYLASLYMAGRITNIKI